MRTDAADLLPAGTTCRKWRQPELQQGNGHSRCVVRLGQQPSGKRWGSATTSPAGRPLHRRRATSIAAGSRARLLIGCAARGIAYRASITHGWTLDEAGGRCRVQGHRDRSQRPRERTGAGDRAGCSPARSTTSRTYVSSTKLLAVCRKAIAKYVTRAVHGLGNRAMSRGPGHPVSIHGDGFLSLRSLTEIDRWALGRTSQLVQKCLKA